MSLHPHQVIELLLFAVIKRRDTNEFAHDLIDHCGGFAEVFTSDIETLTEVKGIGESTAAYLQFIGSLFAKYGGYRQSGGIYLDCTLVIDAFLMKCFRQNDGEQLCISIVDETLRLIDNTVIPCSGDREKDALALRDAVLHGGGRIGCSCILSHYLPSGVISDRDSEFANFIYERISPLLDVKSFMFVRRDGIKNIVNKHK